MSDGIIIAGGGLAGQRCAETLRRRGYDGSLRMVCAEAHRPYDRPPLSKGVLSGAEEGPSLYFRAPEWYGQQDIELLLGVAAAGLAPGERRLELSDGSELRYDQLLIATGSRPRTLPILEAHRNVSVLRTLEDADRLRETLIPGSRLAVIGAGFVGQEVAATARALGASVTLIEAAPSPLIGILGRELGEWFARMHRHEGVEVITERTVLAVIGDDLVRAVELDDGQVIEVDHVLVGIGVQPDLQWLADSGFDVGGIPVDEHGRTAVAGVFAAGDAAATLQPHLGRHVPGSHWEAAGRQGARVANGMLGLEPGAVPVSSFWTDQYGIRIQYLGHAPLADSATHDGDLDSRNFTTTFTRAGRPVAVLLVGRPRDLPHARQLLTEGTPQ